MRSLQARGPASRAERLIALLNGRVVAELEQSAGRTSLRYAEDWRRDPAAFPLSLSLPLAAAAHHSTAVEAYLRGLLPDNDDVLRRWGSRFGVSPRNAFALLAHVGEDCAGAVQFVLPDRLPELLEPHASSVQWIGEEEIAGRLADLKRDPAAGRQPRDLGQFSLAGAQPKMALLNLSGRWGVPSGRMPTTHILKPPIAGFDGHVENEHLCLALARALGLSAADSQVRRFGDEIAIVVTRYDRASAPPGSPIPIQRVHQEDFCQALGVSPSLKYQRDGGPSPAAIVALIREHSTAAADDVRSFLLALAFNWLIAGTDAHTKNYSLLLAEEGQVRLAPLYDLASSLPYPSIDQRKAKLAMKIGRTYDLADVNARQWRRLADELRLDAAAVLEEIARMAEAMPAAVGSTVEAAEGLNHPIVNRLAEALVARAGDSLRVLRM